MQIDLVQHAQQHLPRIQIIGREHRLRVGAVQQFDYNVCLAYSLPAAFYAFLLDDIFGGLNTCGVGEPHQHAANDYCVFNRVARRAADIADYSALVAQQSIEQR